MKTVITSPVPVSEDSSLTAQLADRRRRSLLLADAIQKVADLYWSMVEEQQDIDAEADAIEQHVEHLESLVKFRDESHRSRRRHKRIDRRIAAFHRNGDIGDGMSDAAHVRLTTKARSKAKRDRDCDKTTTRIRKAQLRKQAERGLNPAEVLSVPENRRQREAYYAELIEQRRIAIIAACTDPDLVVASLNGECHEHYGS